MRNLILASVLVLSGPFVAAAQAQHGHGGHGHGGHGHGGHGFGGHYYGGHHSLGHSIGHAIYHGLGYGHGGYYYPSYYYPGSYYYGPSYYDYAYPPTTYVYPRTTTAYPPTSLPSAPEGLAPNQAKIQVILPDPEAQVFFDGAKTSSLGRVRLYDPPTLAPGQSFTYKISATWNQGGTPVSDVRVVNVVGGRVTVVDFTQPATEAVPLPSKKE